MKGLKTEWQALPRGCVAPGSRIRFRTFQSGLSKGGTAFLVGENTISFGKSTKECDPENCFFQLVLYQKKWSKFRQDDLRSLDHQRFASSPKSHSPMHRDAVVSRFSSVALKPWSTVSRPISLFLEVHSISILDTLHLHKWSYSKCILHYTPKKLPWKWKANHLKMVSLVGNGDVSSQSCYFSGGGVDTCHICQRSKPQTPYLQIKVPVPTSRCNDPNRSSTDSAPARPSTSVLAATCRNFTSNRFSEFGREMEGLIDFLGRLWEIESQVAMLRLYGC